MTMAAVENSFLDRIRESSGVRPFPSSAARLMQVTQNPECEASEIVEIIECDPGCASNSSMYGFGGRVRTIQHAVVLLGFRTVRDLAVSIAGAEVFNGSGQARAQSEELWHHSLACALTSRLLASGIGSIPADEAFLSGIFHDVGKLLFLDHASDEYLELTSALPPEEFFDRIIEEENRTFGTDHQELGMDCGEDWGLPGAIISVIGYHHSPDDAPEGYELAELMRLSNRLVRAWNLTGSTDGSEVTDDELSSIDLPITRGLIDEVQENVGSQFEELRQLCT